MHIAYNICCTLFKHNQETMKQIIKILTIIVIEILLNLTFRILQNNYGSNLILTIGYSLTAFSLLFYGLNWITKTINYKKTYWKSVFIILIVVLSVAIFADILFQAMYSDYVFKPFLFSSVTFLIQATVLFFIVSMIIGLFFKGNKEQK